jgi:hypothetical protein
VDGANAGYSSKVTASYGIDIPNFSLGDVIAIEYDDAGHYDMFINNGKIKTWTASGITHGAGYRECGIYSESNGFGGTGPGLGQFVAYDF